MKIAQVLNANSWGDITPEALDKGIGGREGALLRLSKEWAELGHEVTNFVPVKQASRFEEEHKVRVIPSGVSHIGDPFTREIGFHEYIPISLAKPMLASFPYDAVVAWECPTIYDSEHIIQKQKVRLVHMQVAHFDVNEMEAAEQLSTGVVALSEWAKEFLVHSGLEMDDKILYVRPNGVNINDYPLNRIRKNPNNISFVYSSSPDRGLLPLLRAWPDIRKNYSKAKLHVAYGVRDYVSKNMWSHNRPGEMSIEIIERLRQPGVIDVGKIGQKQLANLQMNATAWLYPADTIQPTETGCITAIENMAAGNPCIISDADCLESEFSKTVVDGDEVPLTAIIPLPFDKDKWVEGVEYLQENPHIARELGRRGRSFAESRDWSKIAPTWIDLFKEQANA